MIRRMWDPLYTYAIIQYIQTTYNSRCASDDIKLEKAIRKLEQYNKKYGIENVLYMFHKVRQDIDESVNNGKISLKNLYLKSLPAYEPLCASLSYYEVWSPRLALKVLDSAELLYSKEFSVKQYEDVPEELENCKSNSTEKIEQTKHIFQQDDKEVDSFVQSQE